MITLAMLTWFAGAIVGHDLVAFPLYAAVDRLLVRTGAVNYLRVPLSAAALTFLVFLPGIIRQGQASFRAATGLDQQPYLARWLLLCAVFFVVSALVYFIRRPWRARREPRAVTCTADPQPCGAGRLTA
jgi:hypothetical protein